MKLKVLFYLVIFSILMPVMWYVFNDAFVKEIMDSFSIKNTYTSKEWNILWSLLTALGFVSLYIFSYYFWFRKIGFNRKYIWCYSLYALISLIIVAYLITLLKNHLPRERFYSIMAFHDGDQSYFRNWYSLIWNHSDGTGSRYTSFPSGHTTWAVALIIVIPFTFLNIKQKVWKWSVISFVYTILLITMFSRIQTGSHYLSDVSMSLFIGSFGYCGFYHLFNQILIRFKLS
jgi:membrane-associated phospholipid phosphatase